MLFHGEIESVQKLVDKVTSRQNEVESKMEKVEKMMDSIEKDLYIDSNDYELEIICPYCNFHFELDPDETSDEVECPECKNIIEIDWDGEASFDDECSGNCGMCHGCEELGQDDDDDDM